MKACKRRGSKAPHILDLDIRWWLLVSSTLRPLYLRRKAVILARLELMWAPDPFWTW